MEARAESERIKRMESELGWIILYNWIEDGSIRTWLKKNKPSVIKQSEIAWICARKDEDSRCGIIHLHNVKAATDEWQILGNKAKLDDAFQLASKYHITTGKWMIFATHDSIDRIWEDIVVAMFEGELSHVISMKVSPRNDSNDRHVICIYNNNFLNKKEVFESEASLRKVYHGTLTYKPDIFTYLGIYKQNEWKIKPTLYVSPKSESRNFYAGQKSGPGMHNHESQPLSLNYFGAKKKAFSLMEAHTKAIVEDPLVEDWMKRRMLGHSNGDK